MKILINTATTFKGGGVQVAYSFIKECVRFPENEYLIVLGEAIGKLINQEEFPSNFMFFRIPYRPAEQVFSFKDQARFFKEVERNHMPDVVFTTSGPAYWRPLAPHLMGFNLPHYLYRDSPFFGIISPLQRLKWDLKGAVIKYFTKRDADAYIVQTDDVNSRLRKWISSSEVYTVTNTFGNQYDNEIRAGEATILPTMAPGEFRLLMLSTYYLHKNFELINQIIGLLKIHGNQSIRFVLTLPEKEFHDLAPVENRAYIYNVGPVKPQNCPQLYRECNAVFLPTLLECFSATYAEAMKMRLPIITTDLGFAHTVCGDAALYFKPLDSKDALEKILELSNNEKVRAWLIEKGQKEIKKFNNAHERASLFLSLSQKLIENKA